MEPCQLSKTTIAIAIIDIAYIAITTVINCGN